MKSRALSLIILWMVWMPFSLPAQITEVMRAVREGNAAQIAEHLSATVEVATPDYAGNFGQRQAREILAGFFNGQRPTELVQRSLVETNGARHYIGQVRMQGGQAYRVVIQTFRDAQSQRELVRVIRFENER